MDTKSLLYGLIGFFIGGLIVSIAASLSPQPTSHDATSMDHAVSSLRSQRGDAFDEAFISEMITHHQSAIDMAELADTRTERSEIKQLAQDIMAAQESEINQMRNWQKDWFSLPTHHSE